MAQSTWVRFYPLQIQRWQEGAHVFYGPAPDAIKELTIVIEREANRIGAEIQSVTPITASMGQAHLSVDRMIPGQLDHPGAATCGLVVVYQRPSPAA